jgi:hypothetical protein
MIHSEKGVFFYLRYIYNKRKKMKRIIRLTESDLTRIVKRVIEEESTDCSKLKIIPKGGIKGKTAEGTPKSDTWKKDIAKIGNATTTYIFDGPLIDAINTQRKCHRAKTSVTYSEFVKDNGSSYTFIGLD